MSFEVETPTETQAKVHIRVSKEDLEHAVDHELGHLKERVKLPGFRPGKIPKQVLQKKYGDALRNDVAKRLLQKAYADALAERKLHPVDPPTMRDEDLKPREDGS